MKYLKIMSIFVLALTVFSCTSDDAPKPTADFFYKADQMDPLTVTFTGAAIDADTYKFDFGDGEISSDNRLVVEHTYIEPGDYTVKFSAEGDGGLTEVSKTVTVEPSLEYMLTGGKNATNGRTWKMKYGVSDPVGKEGAGPVTDDLTIAIPIDESGFLDYISLPQGYKDKFTFYYGGRYEVDNSDFHGGSLMGLVYAKSSGDYKMLPFPDGDILGLSSEIDLAPLADIVYEPKKNASWRFNYDDFKVNAVDLTTGNPYQETFKGKIQLVLDEYLMFKDYKTVVILKDIYKTDEGQYEMSVAIALYAAEAAPNLATHLVHLTLFAEN